MLTWISVGIIGLGVLLYLIGLPTQLKVGRLQEQLPDVAGLVQTAQRKTADYLAHPTESRRAEMEAATKELSSVIRQVRNSPMTTLGMILFALGIIALVVSFFA